MKASSHQEPIEGKLKKRSVWRRVILPLTFVVIVVPLIAQVLLVFIDGYLLTFPVLGEFRNVPKHVFGVVIMISLGYWYAKKAYLSATFLGRYGWFMGAVIYTLLIWCAAMLLGGNDYSNELFQAVVLVGLAPFLGVGIISMLSGNYQLLLFIPLGGYALVILGYALGTWRKGSFKLKTKGLLPTCITTLALLGVASCQMHERSQWMISAAEDKVESLSEGSETYAYIPFYEYATKHTPLQGESTLRIEKNFPRLDGATALFPIYASAVQSIYKAPQTQEERDAMSSTVRTTRTPNAYQNLIDNEVDLIFAAAPSAQQIQAAREKGLEFKLTPVGKEAFVFIVNQKNSVTHLTIEQIQAIYTGEVNKWSEVGGSSHALIRAFQRPEGSGSQSTMINQVMKERPLRAPLKEEFFEGMGGVLVGVANYRNAENALGYSFRFYVTQMQSIDGIRLLAINGIEPTRENIQNSSYPFANNFYMVTIKSPERPLSENTQKLMSWFLSEQGQRLIEDVGYVPLLKISQVLE